MDFFLSHSRDVTPTELCSTVHVVFLPVLTDTNIIQYCRSVLSPGELQQADKIATEGARQQFMVRRAFQRFCGATALGAHTPIENINFKHTQNGQPFLTDQPNLSFSFSACAIGYLAAWSDHYKLGVDLEDPNRAVEPVALAKRYFARSEIDIISQAQADDRKAQFLKLWTLKEAALKSLGKGLAYGLDVFAFAIDPEIKITNAPAELGGPSAFHASLLPLKEAPAALVYHQRSLKRL